jgi:hypothetical protein
VNGRESDSTIPPTLRWAVRLVFLEAAGLAVLTAYLVFRLLTEADVHIGVALALIVMAVLAAAAVAIVGRSLSRRTAGARGPAIVVQLFVIASGGFLLQTGPAWAGLPLMALGLLAGLLVVLPASTRALGVD